MRVCLPLVPTLTLSCILTCLGHRHLQYSVMARVSCWVLTGCYLPLGRLAPYDWQHDPLILEEFSLTNISQPWPKGSCRNPIATNIYPQSTIRARVHAYKSRALIRVFFTMPTCTVKQSDRMLILSILSSCEYTRLMLCLWDNFNTAPIRGWGSSSGNPLQDLF